MAQQQVHLTRVVIIDGTAWGPGDHTVPVELARRLKAKGATAALGAKLGAAKQAKAVASGDGEGSALTDRDQLTGEIPEDFPFRTKLIENNVSTLDQLSGMSAQDLIGPGIGEATADRILEALDELAKERAEAAAAEAEAAAAEAEAAN